ncbi:MAG: hypothetical protein COB02_08305 [Candidatus Cloacimonadota bacterium]|nr:MAG: hypothetical protein COB02_08305 [Candidatus Cloacimonadota bacterium]
MKSSIFVVIFILLSSLSWASFDKGLEMYQLKRNRDAAQFFYKAIKSKDNLGGSHYFLARILQDNNESQKALEYYLKAIQYRASHEEFGYRFSLLLSSLQKKLPYSQYKAVFQNAFDKKIFHPNIVYFKVKQAHNRLDYEKIFDIYKQIANDKTFKFYRRNSNQNTSFIYYYLALSYLNEKKDSTSALKYSQLSLKYGSDFKAAKSLFKKLRKKLQKQFDLRFNKANQLLIEKDFDKAKLKLTEALEIFPDSDKATKALSTLKRAKKSFEYTKTAEDFIEKNQITKALKPLKWAIQLYKDNFQAKSLLEQVTKKIMSNLQLKESNDDKSQNTENQFIKFIKLGDNSLDFKDFKEAISQYQNALNLKRNNSIVLQKLKEAKNGLKFLMKFQKAQDLHSKQNFSQTVILLENIIKNNYYYEGIDFLLIDAYYQNKNYSKVLKKGSKILSIQPRNNEVLYLMGVSSYYEKVGDTEALNTAIKYLSKAVNIDSNYLDSKRKLRRFQKEKYTPFVIIIFIIIAILILIIWLFKTKGLRKKAKFLKRYEKFLAKKQFKKLADLYEESLYIEITMAESLTLTPTFIRAFVEIEDYSSAIRHGTQFLKSQKNHKQVIISLGRSFYAINKVDSYTIQFLLVVIDSEYATQDFVSYVGKKCFDLGLDDKKYDPIFLEFSKIYPEHEQCRKILLKHLKDGNRVSPQIFELLKAQVKYDAKDTKSRLQLAEYYLSKRQIEDCISLCEEVINLNVTEKKLHVLLFSAYEKMGNIEELLPIYQSLLEVYPNSTVLQQANNKIKAIIKDQ